MHRDHRQDRSPPLPGFIGKAFSRLYLTELGRRNRRFDRGIGVTQLDRPVISVGNLSVGGTGKTPMVRRVCEWLVDADIKPCIGMRGYRAGPEGSDEAREYRETLPGVPIVAQADRKTGLQRLFHSDEGTGVRAVVLDDGFQHRQLARDLDIVLLDATRSPFDDDALPAGWLRERPTALSRAHAIVVTHAERVSPPTVERLLEETRDVNAALLCAVAQHDWSGLRVVECSAAERDEPISWLTGQSCLAVCGLGNPEPFLATAEESAGGHLAGRLVLCDHATIDQAQANRIKQLARTTEASAIVTTGKDLVKMRKWASTIGVPIAAAKLELTLTSGGQALRDAVLAAARSDRVR